MPKLKTHTGAKKRFKLTKNGKVKRGHAFRSHLLNLCISGAFDPRQRKKHIALLLGTLGFLGDNRDIF